MLASHAHTHTNTRSAGDRTWARLCARWHRAAARLPPESASMSLCMYGQCAYVCVRASTQATEQQPANRAVTCTRAHTSLLPHSIDEERWVRPKRRAIPSVILLFLAPASAAEHSRSRCRTHMHTPVPRVIDKPVCICLRSAYDVCVCRVERQYKLWEIERPSLRLFSRCSWSTFSKYVSSVSRLVFWYLRRFNAAKFIFLFVRTGSDIKTNQNNRKEEEV